MDIGVESIFELTDLDTDLQMALDVIKALCHGRLSGTRSVSGGKILSYSTRLELEDGSYLHYNPRSLAWPVTLKPRVEPITMAPLVRE